MKLRHSHVAVRETLESLARSVKADLSAGEDELGQYRYFDVIISHEDGASQHLRFASHAGDRMVHLLAERIDAVSDLAAALFAVGITGNNALSISTNHEGRPVRSASEISDRIAAMSTSARSGRDSLEIVAGHSGRHPTPPRIALH